MTTCCGDYHYADCPSVAVYVPDPDDDPFDYSHTDPEPFPGCCEAGDVDDIGPNGWGHCMYCGGDVYVEHLDESKGADPPERWGRVPANNPFHLE